jgi:hypothetical protein
MEKEGWALHSERSFANNIDHVATRAFLFPQAVDWRLQA